MNTSADVPRVIKLGGSLLELADWPARLRGWLARQMPSGGVLIIGGGAMVDVVRQWHERFKLADESSHWLAIAAMGVTARLARDLLPEAEWGDSWPLSSGQPPTRLRLLDPHQFLQHEPELPGQRLPASWAATSDSIAARLAVVLGCGELVLLKSCLPPEAAADLGRWAESGYVDACFQCFAEEIRVVRCVDLGNDLFPECASRAKDRSANRSHRH